MSFGRLDRRLPVLLPQFNQSLDGPNGVVELHIVVRHAMGDQEMPLKPVGKSRSGMNADMRGSRSAVRSVLDV